MNDDPKRPWYTQLPAKMVAVVVLSVEQRQHASASIDCTHTAIQQAAAAA